MDNFNAIYKLWGPRELATVMFLDEVTRSGAEFCQRFYWSSDAESLEVLDDLQIVACTMNEYGRGEAFLHIGNAAVLVEIYGGSVIAHVAARKEQVPELVALLKKHLPESTLAEKHEVPFTFWWSTKNLGPQRARRVLPVRPWSQIERNYPSATKAQLEPLLDGFHPSEEGGQLLLWHGPPGTGKTFALRALSWEWRSWCDFHYVSDPEHFFGDAEYLLQVLLHGQEYRAVRQSRWLLLLLEDTGELLVADAKERTGQGLSRLLNVVNGLIGQGLRVLVLVTTNEEAQRMHSAVARPGRCAAKVDFKEFPPQEAQEWLETRGRRASGPHGGMTLAELYAWERGGPQTTPKRAVGFVA